MAQYRGLVRLVSQPESTDEAIAGNPLVTAQAKVCVVVTRRAVAVQQVLRVLVRVCVGRTLKRTTAGSMLTALAYISCITALAGCHFTINHVARRHAEQILGIGPELMTSWADHTEAAPLLSAAVGFVSRFSAGGASAVDCLRPPSEACECITGHGGAQCLFLTTRVFVCSVAKAAFAKQVFRCVRQISFWTYHARAASMSCAAFQQVTGQIACFGVTLREVSVLYVNLACWT